ncbi:MAG: GH92 family glycosyl hydrolase [Bacteroidia bacterium]|nr:GH92 family glycosyl hydrolase [Bacteroidia bacterium]
MKCICRFLLLNCISFLMFACAGNEQQLNNYVQFVNPLQGSNSTVAFSTGNTYPAVAVPWGMNFWTAQTGKMGNGWQYAYTDTTICGFKQTHQPSPWINDFGCFSVMPICGALTISENERASKFSHRNEITQPHYYSVLLEKSGIKAEFAPATRGAIFQFTYPKSDSSQIIIDCFNRGGYVKVIPEENKVVGYSKYYAPNNNAKLPENFAAYFVITINTTFKEAGTWSGQMASAELERTGERVGAYLRFKTKAHEKVEMKIASSFISLEQAQLNFDREIKSFNFATLKNQAAEAWNSRLGRTRIKGETPEQKCTFYTALYRTMLFPHIFHEVDHNGDTVHYSPFSGRTEQGVLYTGNGFWDTFRAVHPYFTIMYPTMSSGIIQGLCNYYKEGGWIPEWFSPGYKDCMIGQNSASVIADAYIKGIRGFDAELLWEAVIKGANNQGPSATGRSGIDYYKNLGYIPYNVGVRESVSKTLEYAYDDYCIAQFGKALGKSDTVIAPYLKRSQNYRNIFNPKINFVQPKDEKGSWQPDYRPDTWGGSFTEGSAWHWTWCVFHDPQGLINLMGGDSSFVSRLDSLFTAKPTFEYSNYKRVIHEMTEMVACNMGQYAHGNQPIQHAIYLYNFAGEPYKTQKHVREVMDKLYSSGLSDGKGLCGDEDNGQTSAWFVFSSMGFYPVCPGSGEYVIGSPLFEEVTLTLENGKIFTVKALNNSAGNVYIQSAILNGKPFERTFIRHDEIFMGGVLEFTMGALPNKTWGTAYPKRPYSMTKVMKQ